MESKQRNDCDVRRVRSRSIVTLLFYPCLGNRETVFQVLLRRQTFHIF